MNKHGHVFKIFVMGGEFEGFQLIELSNWSGKAYLGNRSHTGLCSKRIDLTKAAVYLLLTNDQNEDGVFQMYIGETDSFDQRILHHERKKKWWDKFIVFTSGDDGLTKAHVRYLERELHQLVQASDSPVEIENSTNPGGANLSEAELSFVSSFLENMILTLKTLGFDYFSPALKKPVTRQKDETPNSDNRFYTLQLRDYWKEGKPIKSYMFIQDGKFIVEKGSYIRLNPPQSFHEGKGYFRNWKGLVESSKVSESDIEGLGMINENIEFPSASASASVVRGKATNGATRWKSCRTDMTLKESL